MSQLTKSLDIKQKGGVTKHKKSLSPKYKMYLLNKDKKKTDKKMPDKKEKTNEKKINIVRKTTNKDPSIKIIRGKDSLKKNIKKEKK